MKRKRILFFIYDGAGLGHLKRLCNIAENIEVEFDCLFLSGHKEMSWIVPQKSEFVRLPSLSNLLESKAKYWNKLPFMNLTKSAAIAFRKEIIEAVVQEFMPDIIITDYLPFGKDGEMFDILQNSSAKKYLILRGVLGTKEEVQKEFLTPKIQEGIIEIYDNILIASDQKICDVAKEYGFSKQIEEKMRYVGYVSKPIAESLIQKVRAERGIKEHQTWIVCSSGSGKHGEVFLMYLDRLGKKYPAIQFDIIKGTKGYLKYEKTAYNFDQSDNKWSMSHQPNLHLLHAAADIVICHGGYNSMMECIEGNTKMIVCPNKGDQFIHPKRLKAYYPIKIAQNLKEITKKIEGFLKIKNTSVGEGKEELNFNGRKEIKRFLIETL